MTVFYCFLPELNFLYVGKTRYPYCGEVLCVSLPLKYHALKPLMPN